MLPRTHHGVGRDDRPGPDTGPAPRVADWLAGPPFTLPPLLDRTAERWAGAGPRLRILVLAIAVLVAAGALTVRASDGDALAPAVVASRTIPVAEVVTEADVREVERPATHLPVGAAGGTSDVVGRTVARTVPQGAVLTAGDVADGGPAADLPPGQVAFPLPVPQAGPLEPGLRVDLVTGDGSGTGHLLASGALVLAVGDETVWVAVHRDEAPVLAGASRWGEITPVLLPP